jgi:hypothetical protein
MTPCVALQDCHRHIPPVGNHRLLGGAIIKKIASFRHKTQKFFYFWRVRYQNFFGEALGSTNLAYFPKSNAPPFNSMSLICSPRQQIRIVFTCSCVKRRRHNLPIAPGEVMTSVVFCYICSPSSSCCAQVNNVDAWCKYHFKNHPFGGNLLKPGSLYFRPTTDHRPPTADR